MDIMTMGTTLQHMKILDWFSVFSVEKTKKDPYFHYGREQIALVENYEELIDISKLTDDQRQILRESIGKLKFTYPDFMIFKNNPLIISDNRTRFAGIPDLIIEVWSKSNSEDEKTKKRNLYRTQKSEFWEFEQDSPKVVCWAKDDNIYEQFLDRPLITPWGEKLDLVELSYDVVDILPNDRFHGGPNTGINIDL